MLFLYRRSQAGIALVLGLAMLVLLVSLAMTTFALVSGYARALNREAQRTQARYLAEAGVEIARWHLGRSPDWNGGRFSWGPGTVEVTVEHSTGGLNLTSQAELAALQSPSRPMRAALQAHCQHRLGAWRADSRKWLPAYLDVQENQR